MFELDHELAQDIVDRAMAILPFNVNVMDSQGLILGSGERGRIDTRHEGAQLVLANSRVVEIDEPVAQGLQGVQPGVNLPLSLDGQLIGVLGITGAPAQVRTYAQLVCMTAEMLVAQRHQQGQRQWRRQRSDDFLASLFEGEGDALRLVEEARQLGLKPHLIRTPCRLELTADSDTDALARWLIAHYPDSWCVCPTPGSLWWCRVSSGLADDSRLLDRLAAQGWNVIRMAIASPCHDLAALRRGCLRVNDLMAYGRDIVPPVRILMLDRYRLPALLWREHESEVLAEWVEPLKRVQAKDLNGQLVATLRAWCEHDGQSQHCADALGIHRNSLRYRMERIADLSGIDPMSLPGLQALYLGLQLLPSTLSP